MKMSKLYWRHACWLPSRCFSAMYADFSPLSILFFLGWRIDSTLDYLQLLCKYLQYNYVCKRCLNKDTFILNFTSQERAILSCVLSLIFLHCYFIILVFFPVESRSFETILETTNRLPAKNYDISNQIAKNAPYKIATAPQFVVKLVERHTTLILLGFHTLTSAYHTYGTILWYHFKDPVNCLWFFSKKIWKMCILPTRHWMNACSAHN